MPAPKKTSQLKELKTILGERGNFIITTYSGLDVEKITEVRGAIRQNAGRMKVVKNNLFHLALKESDVHKDAADGVRPFLEGPNAVTFVSGDFPSLSKLLVQYAKDLEPVEIKGGFMDGQVLNKAQVMEIATLPSREELLTIIARGLNTPATKIAMGMKQVMAKLARGIKAVGEKNG